LTETAEGVTLLGRMNAREFESPASAAFPSRIIEARAG
jgi:hypothetical protein